jgi:hypothetical protein
MTNRSAHQDPFLVSGRKELDLNLGPHRQIRQSKHTHANVAEIDSEGIHAGRTAEDLH